MTSRGGSDEHPTRLLAELDLGGEPGDVARARRTVTSSLSGQPESLRSDAALVVSELVTNATLHGEPPVKVRLLQSERVRLEVSDSGLNAPIVLRPTQDVMTGRGLGMIAAVSSAWGVEPLAQGGKLIWVELAGGEWDPGEATRDMDVSTLVDGWRAQSAAGPARLGPVRLGAVPTSLLLEAKSHMDNVVRELTLIGQSGTATGPLPPVMATLVDNVTVDFAGARAQIKRQAAAAAARGEELTVLELYLEPSAAAAGERYLDALDEADRYARSARLLTLAPPPVHRAFRQWYVRSVVEQLRCLARGETPPEPPSFDPAIAEPLAAVGEDAEA